MRAILLLHHNQAPKPGTTESCFIKLRLLAILALVFLSGGALAQVQKQSRPFSRVDSGAQPQPRRPSLPKSNNTAPPKLSLMRRAYHRSHRLKPDPTSGLFWLPGYLRS